MLVLNYYGGPMMNNAYQGGRSKDPKLVKRVKKKERRVKIETP